MNKHLREFLRQMRAIFSFNAAHSHRSPKVVLKLPMLSWTSHQLPTHVVSAIALGEFRTGC